MKNYAFFDAHNKRKGPVNQEQLLNLLKRNTLFNFQVVPVQIWSCRSYPKNLFLVISETKENSPKNEDELKRSFSLLARNGIANLNPGHAGACRVEFPKIENWKGFYQCLDRVVKTAPAMVNIVLQIKENNASGYILFYRSTSIIMPYLKGILDDAVLEPVAENEILNFRRIN